MPLNLKSGEEAEFLKLFISYNYTFNAMALLLSKGPLEVGSGILDFFINYICTCTCTLIKKGIRVR